MPIIRVAKLNDADLIAPLFDSYRQYYGRAPDAFLARAFICERLQRNESVIFVVEDNDKLSGFVQLYPSFTSAGAGRTWILNDLFVVASARRKGRATSLLKAAEAFAKDSGAIKLCLSTARESISAQILYENLGWKKDKAFITYELNCS